VSRHWNPEDDLAQAREERRRAAWPHGATAGLALIAVGCIGVAAIAYWAAAPRHSFADDSAIDWEGLPSPPPAGDRPTIR
jgi:hypothetical protein